MEDTSYLNASYDLKVFFYNQQIKTENINKNKSSVIYINQGAILNLFKIDLTNHRKARLALHYHLHMQPSEIDNMDYMDFEYLLIDLNDLLKEKNEAEKKSYDDQKSGMPNTGKMNNFKMPKMNVPKTPKL